MGKSGLHLQAAALLYADGYTPTDPLYPDQWHTKNTGQSGGTSSATPPAAGIAALVLSKQSDLTPVEVRAILEQGANEIGCQSYVDHYNKYYGHGRVNANAALAAVPPPCDFDHDADVDVDDFDTLNACSSGPGGTIQNPGPGGEDCDRADVDQDNGVDLIDFATFQSNYTG